MDKVQLQYELKAWGRHILQQYYAKVGWSNKSSTAKVCEQLKIGIIPERVIHVENEDDPELIKKYNRCLRLIKTQYYNVIKTEYTNPTMKQKDKAKKINMDYRYYTKLLSKGKSELLRIVREV